MNLLDKKVRFVANKCREKYGKRLIKRNIEHELMSIRITKQDIPYLFKKYGKDLLNSNDRVGLKYRKKHNRTYLGSLY
jgi:hypothetical protein